MAAAYRLWWLSATEYYRLRRRAEQRRMGVALLFALAAHVSLLKLAFGGHGGLPGLDLRWIERRFEVPELRVALLPKATPPPEPAPPQPKPAARAPARKAKSAAAPDPVAAEVSAPVLAVVPSQLAATERAVDSTPLLDPAPSVIALAPTEKPVWVIPVPSEIAVAAPARRRDAMLEEAVTLAAERREAARREAARREALQRAIGAPLEDQGIRAEPSPRPSLVEAPQIEVARTAAPAVEVARPAAPQVEVAPTAAPQVEAARSEAPARGAPRTESPQLASAPAPAAREEAEREARLRRLGRQLDEEAERRKAAFEARQVPLAAEPYRSPRRYRLFGRADPNEAIMRYAEAWSRKIEMNMTLEMIREAVKLPHTKPLVTVAVRGDGSVESVTIVVSSGVPAIDQAIRQVVESQAPYAVFPPALALEYDVIEIRRTWHFDVAVRLD